MKELLIDKSYDFFELLSKEKKEWFVFYFEYVKNAPYIFSEYHRINHINKAQIEKIILSFERRFLDKAFQSLGELGPYKYEVAKLIVDNSKSMNIEVSKTHIYIVGALDFDPIVMIDDENIMVDVLALYRLGFQHFSDILKANLRR